MAYNGVTPSNVFGQGSKDSFDGDGSTTAFTLSKAVKLTTDVEVFVGNVRQEPTTAYTVSGTTLTFTGTPASGTANIYAQGWQPPKSLQFIAVGGALVSDALIATARELNYLFIRVTVCQRRHPL